MIKILTSISVILVIFILLITFYFKGEEYQKHIINIDNIKDIEELFITKITYSKIEYLGEKEKILLRTRGHIYYYINFKNLYLSDTISKKEGSVILDKPYFDVELDENNTSIFLTDEEHDIADTITFKYSEISQKILLEGAESIENISIARKQAEEFIIGYLKQFDYTVNKVYWRDLTKENLSKETLKDINFDVLSKLVLCNESNNNTLKEIDLKYTIERNGGIDSLILSKDVDKKFGDCVENSLKEIKHEEYYGKEEKIEKSFNLDKDKICKKLRKKESWLNSNSEKLRKLNCKEEIE